MNCEIKMVPFIILFFITCPISYLTTQQVVPIAIDTLPAPISYELVPDTLPISDFVFMGDPDTVVQTLPIILQKSIPAYPDIAIRVRIEGNITVRVRVDTVGKPIAVEDWRCDFAGFEEPTLHASRRWIFSRYLRKNQPREFFAYLTFKFRLSGAKPLVIAPK